jgi:hypothetical protein
LAKLLLASTGGESEDPWPACADQFASTNYDGRVMPGNLKLKADASAPETTDLVFWLATPDAAHPLRADALDRPINYVTSEFAASDADATFR